MAILSILSLLLLRQLNCELWTESSTRDFYFRFDRNRKERDSKFESDTWSHITKKKQPHVVGTIPLARCPPPQKIKNKQEVRSLWGKAGPPVISGISFELNDSMEGVCVSVIRLFRHRSIGVYLFITMHMPCQCLCV